MANKVFTRDALLGANLKVKKVKAGSLGYVYIKQMNGRQLLSYKEKAQSLSKDGVISDSNSLELLALLVCNSLCDENGKLLYSEQDIPALLENSFETLLELGKLSEAILELSGVDVEQAKEVAANLKNAHIDSSITS